MMGPMQAISTCLAKSFALNGRASRQEYWWFLPVGLLLPVLCFIGLEKMFPENYTLLNVAISAVFLFPLIAVTARRLQDTGKHSDTIKTPASALAGFVVSIWAWSKFGDWLNFAFAEIDAPAGFGLLFIAGPVALIILATFLYFLLVGMVTGAPLFGQMLVPSEPGMNKYGPNPLEAHA